MDGLVIVAEGAHLSLSFEWLVGELASPTAGVRCLPTHVNRDNPRLRRPRWPRGFRDRSVLCGINRRPTGSSVMTLRLSSQPARGSRLPPASPSRRPTGLPRTGKSCGRWTHVPGVRYLRKMINGVPVVAAPAEIDTTAAEHLRAVLLDSAARRHATIPRAGHPNVPGAVVPGRQAPMPGGLSLCRPSAAACAGVGAVSLAVRLRVENSSSTCSKSSILATGGGGTRPDQREWRVSGPTAMRISCASGLGSVICWRR
jgi:hypothetical protein